LAMFAAIRPALAECPLGAAQKFSEPPKRCGCRLELITQRRVWRAASCGTY
jgi:hypothetical protein